MRSQLQAFACLNSKSGFTLVELLAVVAIIVALMALTIPAISPATKGVEITQSGSILAGELQAARLEAISRNRPVEVRFYENQAGDAYDRVGFLIIRDDMAFTTFRSEFDLPDNLIIPKFAGAQDLVPLLDSTADGITSGTEERPNGTANNYVAFRFRPDGSTTLDPDPDKEWFLTIIHQNDQGKTPNSNPRLNNFTSIQVEPLNGRIRVYRP